MQGLVALFEDLEQQAYGLQLQERDDEIDGLEVAEYGSVDLVSRLHASVGSRVSVALVDGTRLTGLLDRVGADFGLLDDGHASWLFRPDAATRVVGLSPRSMTEQARPVRARLGVGSMLRRLAEERVGCVVHLVGAQRVEGTVLRVGRDFFELAADAGERDSGEPTIGQPSAVPIRAVAAIRISR